MLIIPFKDYYYDKTEMTPMATHSRSALPHVTRLPPGHLALYSNNVHLSKLLACLSLHR